MSCNCSQQNIDLRGLAALSDEERLGPARTGGGFYVGRSAVAMAGSAISGALVGWLAGGNRTSAATGASIGAGLTGAAYGALGFSAPAAVIPAYASVALLLAGGGLLFYGGRRAYRTVKAGRPTA